MVNTTDENFRVNPNNGVRSDSPANDTDLSPVSSLVDAVAKHPPRGRARTRRSGDGLDPLRADAAGAGSACRRAPRGASHGDAG